MAIKIKSLGVDKLTEKSLQGDYLYKDFKFDLSQDVSYNNQLNRVEYLKDIAVLYDVEAVKNSVKTALLTSPGDKLLNPTYGVDLRQFLFEPIDEFTAEIIQDIIETKLPDSEPRITVNYIEVIADEDNNTYNINLQIDVPSLNIRGLSIKSELNSIGYTIL
jgi:phage baseplate assembly protein W